MTDDTPKPENWDSLVSQLYNQSGEGTSDSEAHLVALYHLFEPTPDRYEIMESLGRGGWKEVFLAFDKHCGREAAFAVPADPENCDTVEAFLREARIIASLEHPGIISLYNLGLTGNGVPFYAMEIQQGGSLHEALREKTLSSDQALEIFSQVCHAIAYAHLEGITHLDLKPENIQVGNHGVVKVCDWGLSASYRRPNDEEKVAAGFYDLCGDNGDFSHAKGTPGYLAPERQEHHCAAAPSADIFSLGVILKDVSALFPKKERKRLTAIVEKASATAPDARYHSVEALQSDLQLFSRNKPMSVEPSAPTHRLRLFLLRNQQAVTYAAVCCAVVGIISAVALGSKQRAQSEVTKALSEKLEAQELRLLAETEAQDAQAQRVRDVCSQTEILQDLIIVSPSLSQQTLNECITILTEVINTTEDQKSVLPAYTQLGTAYFISQRFDLAAECFQKSGTNDALSTLSEQYAQHTKSNAPLSSALLIQLLNEPLLKDVSLQQKMVYYDRTRRADWQENVQITLTWIENINPHWEAGKCRWSEPHQSLILRGKGLKTLTAPSDRFQNYNKNILQGLDLNVLRLEETDFTAYGQLGSLKLTTLHVPYGDKKSVKQLKDLRPDLNILFSKRGS